MFLFDEMLHLEASRRSAQIWVNVFFRRVSSTAGEVLSMWPLDLVWLPYDCSGLCVHGTG